MFTVKVQIFQDHLVLVVDHTVMVTVTARLDRHELLLVSQPHLLETPLLDGKQQATVKVVGLVVAGIDIHVGADNRVDLNVGAPVILLVKGAELGVVGIKYFKGS